MKKNWIYVFCTLLLGVVVCGCNNELDIQQDYPFDLVTLPVQKKIAQGETAEIRCTLVREGEFKQAQYFIRYFQPDGKGELKMEDGTVLLPNDLYPLEKMVFRLYYTSHSTNQQSIDIYIENNFGQVVQKTFSWQSENDESNRTEKDE
ncbi:MAG: DUF3872 domain-containing protein [Proteiniphilum sp.]|uniref:DUF3872 domain-containing protein n=1 Tax=Bacteroides graminisolvens TaxID=477666 RepID=UPI00169B1273|nr:DUF3872 domain-containing protein [Bacteroides graminisolvens]NLX81093.1 DUF3872 domain-containing protein [Proteiniphilum sp.]